jgi:hypothetical protein
MDPIRSTDTNLAATLVRILTSPRFDSERRDVRRIEKFIREIVKQELKANA